jgi:hypothetical protein
MDGEPYIYLCRNADKAQKVLNLFEQKPSVMPQALFEELMAMSPSKTVIAPVYNEATGPVIEYYRACCLI